MQTASQVKANYLVPFWKKERTAESFNSSLMWDDSELFKEALDNTAENVFSYSNRFIGVVLWDKWYGDQVYV